MKILKIVIINVVVLILVVISLETISLFGRMILKKEPVPWMLQIVSNEDAKKNDCYNYRTDVYLSHIHNHNNNCEILGGYAKGGFVHYDENYNDREVIFILGGSTTDGMLKHIHKGKSWGYLLDKILEKNGKKIDIINGGVASYNTNQELMKLVTQISNFDLNIKYIISFNGINELKGYPKNNNYYLENFPNYNSLLLKMMNDQKWLIQDTKNYIYLLPNFQTLILKSRKIISDKEKKRLQIDNSLEAAMKNYNNKIKNHADRWEINVKMMHSVSKAIGAEYYVFLQPTMGLPGVQSEPKIGTQDEIIFLEKKKKYPEKFDEMRLLYVSLKEKCAKINFCFDISNTAPPLGNYYFNSTHHNDLGNQIIAEEIYNKLF